MIYCCFLGPYLFICFFLKKGEVLNVNLSFVTNVNQVKLNNNDSLLLIGKSKDLRKVNHESLSKPLSELQIPKQVRLAIIEKQLYFIVKLKCFFFLSITLIM